VVIGVTPFEWDVRVSSKEDPGGHADVYWPGSLHHSTGHYYDKDAEGPTFRQLTDLSRLVEFQAKQASPIKSHWEAMAPLVTKAIADSGLTNNPKWAALTPKHREIGTAEG